ncbi:UNVERIFIED_CONTAM: hypothetical protein K2H54_034962 [Gekko kuhli]
MSLRPLRDGGGLEYALSKQNFPLLLYKAKYNGSRVPDLFLNNGNCLRVADEWAMCPRVYDAMGHMGLDVNVCTC